MNVCLIVKPNSLDYKVQNPTLMKEVRLFEPAALMKAPAQKKNLKPVRSIHVNHA